jgi:hypothetical protein
VKKEAKAEAKTDKAMAPATPAPAATTAPAAPAKK